MEEQIARFLVALEGDRGFSHNTVSAYRNDLSQFLAFISSEQSVGCWQELSDTHLTTYVLHLRERKYANSTVARKVAAVRSFCGFLNQNGIIRQDPAAGLPSPKVDKFVPKAISAKEMDLLLEQASKQRTPEGMRDRAMLETLYATGMRVSELMSIDVEDVDLINGTVQCGRKPDRCRPVPITESAVSALAAYLEVGRPLLRQSNDESAVFLNHRGKRLTRQGFWLILKAHAEAANIEGITPHTIRHTFAAHAVERGHELRDIQRILGHMSISTTQVYQRVAAQSSRESNGRELVEALAASFSGSAQD